MAHSSKFVHYFKIIDLFGVSPTLSYQGRGKQKSFYGGIISFIIFIYMIFAFMVSFDDMVLRKNPNIVISNAPGRDVGIKLSRKSFNFGVFFYSSATGNVMTDPTIVTFNILQVKVNLNTTSGQPLPPKITTIPTIDCNSDQFPNISLDPVHSHAKCINVDNPNAEIGIPSKELMSVLLNKCQNSTNSNITCKSQEEIDTVFNTHIVVIIYSDFSVDPNDFKKPVSYFINSESMLNSATLSKNIRFVLEEVDFVDDRGYFLADKSTESHVRLKSIFSDVNSNNQQSFEINFHMSGRKVVQTRTYLKFQQALAGAISLIRVALIIGTLFIVPCQKIKYFQDMIQELFSFRDIESFPSSEKYQLKVPKVTINELQSSQSNVMNSSVCSSEPINDSDCGRKCAFTDYQKQNKPYSIFKEQQKESQINPQQVLDFNKNLKEINESPQQSPKSSDDEPQKLEISTNLKSDEVKTQVNNNIREQDRTTEPLHMLENFNNDQQYDKFSNQSLFQKNIINSWFRNNFSCFKDEEKRKFKIGRNKIMNDLSIISLLKSQRDFERLKCLVLDEEQRVLFENLPLPSIYSPQKIPNILERKLSESNNKISQSQEFDKVKQYFKSVATRQHKNMVDVKLLEWFKTGQYPNL